MSPLQKSLIDFIPQHDTDLEMLLKSTNEENEENEEQEALNRTWIWGDFVRPSCWAVCSSTALYTTKQLMTTHRFHYPLTIAFRALSTTLIMYIIWVYITAAPTNASSGKSSRWNLGKKYGSSLLLSRRWATMLPASMIGAVLLPIILRGILHMPSLPVLVMLFPVIYTTESLVLFICCSASKSGKWLPWETVLSILASSIVLYNDNRLMVPGLIWGLAGLILTGLCRACFTIGSGRSNQFAETKREAYHDFAMMTLVLGAIISGLWSYAAEHIHSIYAVPHKVIALVVIKILSFVGVASCGTSLLAYSPISSQEGKPSFSNIPVRLPELFPSSAASIFILLVNLYSENMSYISWIQSFAYLVSMVTLAGADQIHEQFVLYMDSTQRKISKSFGKKPSESRQPTRLFTAATLFSILAFFSWSSSTLGSASINSLPLGLPSKLDNSYEAASRFDIVVSMYQEDPLQVKQMLDKIKATTPLSGISPRVIIYIKDPEADLNSIQQSTGADIVSRLDNLGREGGTYLWHIVNKWDSLASQTMFLQAHAHNMRELIPRINSYLVPETGMLSLGFAGVACACNTCGDMFDWEDKWNVVPTLYERIYSQPCTERTPPIQLSYKGQFVASARRVRGVEKKIYEGLLKTITSVDGWSHNSTIIGDMPGGTGEDSPDNPYFGFTVERIWSLLMQCATDPRVAMKCPSLLSGMSAGGSVEDCQCLDKLWWKAGSG